MRISYVVLFVVIALYAGVYLGEFVREPDRVTEQTTKPDYDWLSGVNHAVSFHWIDAPDDPGSGGDMIAWRDGLLLMTRAGDFYRLRAGRDGFDRVEIAAPFDFETEQSLFERRVNRLPVGARALAAREAGGTIELFVSHTRAHPEKSCVTLALSRTRLEEAGGALRQAGAWETVYETRPCNEAGNAIQVLQASGMLAFAPDGAVLMAVGDYGIDEFSRGRETIYPQDPNVDYGKLLRIEPETGSARIVSSGHRNASGLTVDSEGEVWLVEHGPRGGDELNHVRDGANYGWPLVTYGVQYGTYDWPLNVAPGRHDGFEKPVFSWVPSIAVSGLLELRGDEFPLWRGDLFVASLAGNKLVRLRRAEGPRIVLAEEFALKTRVRAIAEMASGEIALKLDAAPYVGVLSAAGIAKTAEVAEVLTPCAQCHSFAAGAPSSAGPNLAKLWGRKIGAEDGYAYSAALAAKGGSWTLANLKAFLSDADGFAPGTTMPDPGLSGEELSAVLNALRSRE